MGILVPEKMILKKKTVESAHFCSKHVLTTWLLLIPHQLYSNRPISGSIEIDQKYRLPLSQDKFRLSNGDCFRIPQYHAQQMRMGIDGLLVSPLLQNLWLINIPPIVETSLSFGGGCRSSINVVVLVSYRTAAATTAAASFIGGCQFQ
mmetsp:Transcript_9273/g.16611  ORF Transcript_9273/g.16611 Transcript_9273/m.16611 type:complete len:148 (-) Transcript_9273:245-688(-)